MAAITSTQRTAVLQPGQCIILPADAVVTSIILDGAATVTSTCGTLPTPSSYKCGFFSLLVDNDDNPDHSMDEQDTYYVSIKVGGTTYIINELVVQGENPGTATAIGTLNLHITDTALFEFKAVTQTDLSKRSAVWLFFKVPEPLFDALELKVTNHGVEQYHKPYEAECDEYPEPE